MLVSFLSIANFLVIVFVKSERALLDKYDQYPWMSNYLKKITENSAFGISKLYRFCEKNKLVWNEQNT